uniref:Uncharacterized protein n=1 Tax=Rhizophora mucronata TaxID=61149 RepID=A0A2P2IWR2_RHIMU
MANTAHEWIPPIKNHLKNKPTEQSQLANTLNYGNRNSEQKLEFHVRTMEFIQT